MPVTIAHALSATTPDDPNYEIQVQHWNSQHANTLSIDAVEISGLFSNANGISFGLSDSSITASYTQSTHAHSSLAFSNTNGVTFGVNASTLTASVGTNYAGVGETVGTVAGTDLALTVNTDGVSIAYPKWITTARGSADAIGLNTAQTAVTWTVNSSGISIDAGAYLTTARRSTDAVGLNTAQTNVIWTVNSSGLSFNAGGYAGTGFTSTTTAGTDVKATNNTSGLSMAVPAFLTTAQPVGAYLTTARASTDAVGLNTAQTNVSWTVNSSGISINAGGYAGTGTSMTNASATLDSNGLKLAVAAPGGAATYSNYFSPIVWDENSATSTLSLSNLAVQPFTLGVNLSFGQINFIGSASVAPTSASNNFSVRLTNSTQAHSYNGFYSATNSNLVDLYVFSRGTGNFSTELESVFSTRNSWITYYFATHSGSATLTNTAGGSIKVSQAFSMSISYPMVTSGQVINGASSHTTWGTGYTTWTSTASNNSVDTYSTSAAKAIALASTYPGTTVWTSNKMIVFNLGTTMSAGEWWLGMVRYSSTSSSSSTSGAFTGAAGTGNSFSTTYAGSALTQTAVLTIAGQTATVLSSLGWLGFQSQSSMAPSPGLGSFSGTYTGTQTYVNNAGNPAGAIAFSDLRTQVSFFSSWFQMASNRI